jgi:enoyl-CoA hydratase
MTAIAAPFPFVRSNAGHDAGILTIRLEQPGRPVVVLDLELIQRLEATLKALPPDATGLVLASASERVFVAGADLKSISEWPDEQLHRYLEFGARVFGMLAALPFPTAAAINGAALGGGLELAMHCDALIGLVPQGKDGLPAKPYPIGLPESSLGLCPGWGGTNLLPARMMPAEAIRRTCSGANMTFDEARSAGLFDALAETSADLEPRARAWVVEARRSFSRRDGVPSRWIGRAKIAASVLEALDGVKVELATTGSARAVVKAVEAGLSQGWPAALQVERDELVRLRHTSEAKASLEAFFAKSSGKK